MDKEQLMGLAKQAYKAYMNSQASHAQEGASSPRPPSHTSGGTPHTYAEEDSQTDNPPAYDSSSSAPPHAQAQSQSHLSPGQAEEGAHAARVHAQSPLPQDNPLAGALGMLMDHLHQGSHQVPVDEEHVQQAHAQAYGQGKAGGMSASSMGTAAAVQILQKLSSHGSAPGSGSGGSTSQADLIHLAMSEAAKLFDKSGGAASGNKQEAINNAAMTVMKLLVQSKSGGAGAGQGGAGGGSSSVQGLMALASKFAH